MFYQRILSLKIKVNKIFLFPKNLKNNFKNKNKEN